MVACKGELTPEGTYGGDRNPAPSSGRQTKRVWQDKATLVANQKFKFNFKYPLLLPSVSSWIPLITLEKFHNGD